MTTSESLVPIFESTLQTTHKWLCELKLLASLRDESEAYSVLRAVLHTLRDRLIADEAVDLAAQLPMLIREFLLRRLEAQYYTKKIAHTGGFSSRHAATAETGQDL